MSTIKIYNNETQEWISVGSSEASGVFTNNGILTQDKEEGLPKSVEEILLRHDDEIELLQKNVSWLAEHGGGGGGGGGGGDSASVRVDILSPTDGTTPVNDIIWSSNILYITYKLTTKSTSDFNVVVRVNGVTIITETGVRKNERRTIPAKSIGITNKDVTLSVTATDVEGNEYVGICSIRIASVTLSPSDLKLTVSELAMGGAASYLNVTYRTSIIGNYKLYLADSPITYHTEGVMKYFQDAAGNNLDERGQYIDISSTTTNATTIAIPVKDTHGTAEYRLLEPNTVPGTYVKYFRLANSNDPESIFSDSASSSINLVNTNGMLVSPLIGADEGNPFIITKDSILQFQFRVYSSGTGMYSYQIFRQNNEELRSVSTLIQNQSFDNTITYNLNLTQYLDQEGIGVGNYVFVIRATQGVVNSDGYVYVTVSEPTSELVHAYKQDLKAYTVFDYTFWDIVNLNENNRAIYSNPLLYNRNTSRTYADDNDSVDSSLTLYRIGTDSVYDRVFYRLTHTAYAVIKNESHSSHKWFSDITNDTTCVIPKQDYSFTFQIAYAIGNEPQPNVVVFRYGDYDVNTGFGNGILITSHNYYVKIGQKSISGVLQDNNFTQLNIVVTHPKQSVQYVNIYQNGILLRSETFEMQWNLYPYNEIFIACGGVNPDGTPIDNINTDVYSVKLFETELNEGQIICEYINNYANYRRTDGGLDASLITNMLSTNGISPDNNVPYEDDGHGNRVYDTSQISSIYNFRTGEYTWGLVTDSTGEWVTLPETLLKIPLPILTLTVGWTYDEFSSTNGLQDATGCKFDFRSYDPIAATRATVTYTDVTVKIQGTTTANYTIKNLDVVFPEGVQFSPKNTWFPESEFTLKADVVDSGHINNAVIGKFVNDIFNSEHANEMLNISEGFPTKNLIENYKTTQATLPNTLTMKATVEGFPFILIVNFVKRIGESVTRDVRLLGIYSFNLGRGSHSNQGYEVPRHLYAQGSTNVPLDPTQAVFPGLFTTSDDFDRTYSAYCYEGTRSFNNKVTPVILSSTSYDYASVFMGVDNDGNDVYNTFSSVMNVEGYVAYGNGSVLYGLDGEQILYNDENVKKYVIEPDGYFWSTDSSYVSNLWDAKYIGGTTALGSEFMDRLNKCIASKMEYNKGNVKRGYQSTIEQYRITSAMDAGVTTEKTGAPPFTITFPDAPEPLEISVRNSAFYYVIAMLFGLVDNLGKNLQMKLWVRSGESSPSVLWNPSLYDLDCGNGLGNTGNEDVEPTVLDSTFANTPDNVVAEFFGDAPQAFNKAFTVYSNKMWGAMESKIMQQKYSTDFPGEENYQVYAKTWNNLRTYYIPDVDTFFEEYFENHMSGCGEFLFNYDYYVKYLNTAQRSMLHGNRLSFIKNWLRERVAFLDSVFGYRYGHSNESVYLTSTSLKPYNRSWKDKINIAHNSGSLSLPVVMNKSVITKTVIGGTSVTYTYTPKNTETNIVVADSLNTSDIQTTINNSDCIIELNDLTTLNITGLIPQEVNPVYVTNSNYDTSWDGIYSQYGSLCSLRRLDLSGVRSLTAVGGIDFFKLFKTWDKSPLGNEPDAFGLQELLLSNVYTNRQLSANLGGTPYSDTHIPAVYKAPFKNIVTINVSGSDVNSVIVPSGVTFFTLNVESSTIQSIKLDSQPLLYTLPLTNCGNLSNIEITNCSGLTTLTLDSTNKSVQNITIGGCNALTSVVINASDVYTHVPSVYIENCPLLSSIQINGCSKETTGDTGLLYISNLPSLTTLNLQGSNYQIIKWDEPSYTNLKTINLKGTKIHKVVEIGHDEGEVHQRDLVSETINGTEVETNDYVDFIGLNPSKVTSLNMSENTTVKYIVFANDPNGNTYFPLTTSGAFYNCTSLRRVFGNVTLNNASIFKGCKNFSITGKEATKFNGENIFKESSKYVVCHPTDNNGMIETAYGRVRMKTLGRTPGEHITDVNMLVNGSSSGSCSDMFYNSGVTTFDAYYALTNITSNVKTLSNMFYTTRLGFGWKTVTNSGHTTELDNSPSRKTFFNCGNVTSIASIFNSAGFPNQIRLFSPTQVTVNSVPMYYCYVSSVQSTTPIKYTDTLHPGGLFNIEEATEIISTNTARYFTKAYNNDGLFSYLTKCTNISACFYGNSGICVDKDLFRRSDGVNYMFTSINHFTPGLIYDEIGQEETPYTNATLIKNAITSENNILANVGDVSGFLFNCPSVTNAFIFLSGTLFINYNKLRPSVNCQSDDNINCVFVRKISDFTSAFSSQYALGTLEFSNIFTQGGKTALKNFYHSFIIQNTATAKFDNQNVDCILDMRLNDRTFDGFQNLVNIGYISSGDSTGDASSKYSFSGSGLYKHITSSTFPYDMFNGYGDNPQCPSSTLKQVVGLFRNVGFDTEPSEPITLPGDLFRNCTSLTEISYCFYNFKVPNGYYLSELNQHGIRKSVESPFENCKSLNNVQYLFGVDVPTDNSYTVNYLKGFIPARFFFHGYTGTSNASVTGTDYTIMLEVNELNSDSAIIYNNESESTVDPITGNTTTITHGNFRLTKFNLIEGEDFKIRATPLTSIQQDVITTVTDTNEEVISEITIKTNVNLDYFGVEGDKLSNNIFTYDYTYKVPNTKISNMTGCFMCSNIDEYVVDYTETEPESISDYHPFTYERVNGKWTEASNKSNNKYTLMWYYDGENGAYLEHYNNIHIGDYESTTLTCTYDGVTKTKQINFEFEWLDDIDVDATNWQSPKRVFDDSDPTYDLSYTPTGRFCTAPDLLRYSTNTCSVSFMFRNCGPSQHSRQYTSGLYRNSVYGIKGRLCPYLLKQISKTATFNYMFSNCKYLSYYTTDNGVSYLIPRTFFSYSTTTSQMNFSSTFLGLMFPASISLDVFNFKGTTRTLDVTNIFRYSLFYTYSESCPDGATRDNPAIVAGIFRSVNATKLRNAFRLSVSDSATESTSYIKEQYVKFRTNFNRYNGSDDYNVYDGYKRIADGWRFDTTKELSTAENRYNYRERS